MVIALCLYGPTHGMHGSLLQGPLANNTDRHTSIFSGAYDGYLWPLVGVWIVDRLARLVSVVSCNVHIRLRGKKILSTESVVSYSQDSDIIKLEVVPGSRSLCPQPGEYYYIYQPLKWRGYESHPFTIGSWNSSYDARDSSPFFRSGFYGTSPFSETTTSMQPDTEPADNDQRTRARATRDMRSYRLVFWIRPYDGWTKRLRSDCLKAPDNKIRPKLLLEGPYGASVGLHNYENVILIVGGTGIAAALPQIEEYIRRTLPAEISVTLNEPSSTLSSSSSSSATLLPTPPSTGNSVESRIKTRTRSITLVWVVRQEAFVHEIASCELSPCLSRREIKTQFYCTSSSPSKKMADENTALLSAADTNDFSPRSRCAENYEILAGRPDIPQLVRANLDDTGDCQRTDSWRNAVLVCGPAGMADETRATVHSALKDGYNVEYIEEAFGW